MFFCLSLEGDEVDEVTVKKILRNKIVITTDKGDQLLVVKPEDFGKPQSSVPPRQQASRSFKYHGQTLGRGSSPSMTTDSAVRRVRTSSNERCRCNIGQDAVLKNSNKHG